MRDDVWTSGDDDAALAATIRNGRDGREFEALGRFMMRPPVSLSRLHFTPGSHEVVYVPKVGHDDIEPTEGERIDAMELLVDTLLGGRDTRRLSGHA